MSGGVVGDQAGDANAAGHETRGGGVPDPVKAREYIQFLIDRAVSVDGEGDPSMGLYELEFDSGIGLVTWVRTAEELLAPNGLEPLLIWMMRESEARGNDVFRLERLPADGGPVKIKAGTATAGDYQRAAAALTQDFLPMAAETEYGTGERDLAMLEARIQWVTGLADAAHFAQEELVRLQLGLTQRAKREAERKRGGSRA